MTKSFVLKALRIFGLEEMLNLSRVAQVKTSMLKKAAGAELIVWDDAPEKPSSKETTPDQDNVLAFKKTLKPSELAEPVRDPSLELKEGEEVEGLTPSEFLLWQRELTKEHSAPTKKDAFKGYSTSTQVYVVKTKTDEGKEKIKFASTNGVLVNKKQA